MEPFHAAFVESQKFFVQVVVPALITDSPTGAVMWPFSDQELVSVVAPSGYRWTPGLLAGSFDDMTPLLANKALVGAYKARLNSPSSNEQWTKIIGIVASLCQGGVKLITSKRGLLFINPTTHEYVLDDCEIEE
jgi:hypothetical protein